MANVYRVKEGSEVRCPECGVAVTGVTVDTESVPVMGEPSGGGEYAPVIDLAPWKARRMPVATMTTYKPCGHTVWAWDSVSPRTYHLSADCDCIPGESCAVVDIADDGAIIGPPVVVELFIDPVEA